MSINNVEIQDNNGNIYYPHTEASVVKYGDSDVGSALSHLTNNPKMQYTSNIATTILKSTSATANWISPQWNLKKYDASYFIDQVDNTLILLKKSGLYLINFAINIPVVFNTNVCIKLVKNFGTTGAEEFAYESKLGTAVSTRINLSAISYFNENETLKCLVYQDSVNNVNLVCGYGFPMISVTKVGEIG